MEAARGDVWSGDVWSGDDPLLTDILCGRGCLGLVVDDHETSMTSEVPG